MLLYVANLLILVRVHKSIFLASISFLLLIKFAHFRLLCFICASIQQHSSSLCLKAADYLEQAEYNTGNMEEDLKTQSLVRQLVYNPQLQIVCPLPFDEAKLWQGESGPELKQQIQRQFRNIRFKS